jgi:hypothetical protein
MLALNFLSAPFTLDGLAWRFSRFIGHQGIFYKTLAIKQFGETRVADGITRRLWYDGCYLVLEPLLG